MSAYDYETKVFQCDWIPSDPSAISWIWCLSCLFISPRCVLCFPKHGDRLTLCFAYDINGVTLLLLHNWYCRYLCVPFVLICGTALLLPCACFWVVFCFLTVTVLTLTPSFPVGGCLPFRPIVLGSTAWSTQSHLSLPHTAGWRTGAPLVCIWERSGWLWGTWSPTAIDTVHSLQMGCPIDALTIWPQELPSPCLRVTCHWRHLSLATICLHCPLM